MPHSTGNRDSLDSLDKILRDYRRAYFYANSQADIASRPETVVEAEKIAKGADTVAKQAIHQWALDIIGEDDEEVTEFNDYPFGRGHEDEVAVKRETVNRDARVMNKLREAQRAKLKGDIDE